MSELTTEPPALPTGGGRSPWWRGAVKWGLVGAAFYFAWRLLAGMRWADLTARLAEASWPLVAAAIFFLVLRFALWDLRFRLAATRATGERAPGGLFGFPVLLASAALNLLNPAARLLGGPLRARSFARACRRPFGLFYGIVLYDQLAHQTVVSALTCLAVLAAAAARGYVAAGLSGLAVLATLTFGLVLWSRRRGPFERNPIVLFLARRAELSQGGLQKVFREGHEAAGVFIRLLADSRMAPLALLLGTILFLANAVAQWLIFRALGQSVGVLPVIAVVALGNAAGMLAGTPGGVGTTEAAMVAAYVTVGVDRASAGAATLLFRGLHYVLVVAVGLPALAWLEARGPRRAATVSGP
ncbi:MAG TPA: lysylphosphatidylglycerol synthase transmembrane domain-containing protein [Thermoanaerobaculia bacterium]|nr:lysylphosphatidylglycerol synthase transmembrane domain-containing protein [Thermoanaerobaculia bacterium]